MPEEAKKMNAYKQVTSWGHIDWLQSKNRDSSMQAEIGIVNLLPRKRQAEHTHYSEVQFLYTLEGHGEHIVDGRSIPFRPGDYFFLPSGITHSTINHSDTTLPGADVLRPCPSSASPGCGRRVLHVSRSGRP